MCTDKIFITLAGFFGASGVALGAYASHGHVFADEAARASMQMAVQYQMLHAPGLLALGIWARGGARSMLLVAAGALFTLGILAFSGFIYLRALGVTEALRGFVPWGGVALMVGWFCVAVAAWRPPATVARNSVQ